jgi:acetyl-CoA synthetase
MQAPDSYYRTLGRIDDVMNVAGHRLGTKELESDCLSVVEAAVVPVVGRTTRARARDLYRAQNRPPTKQAH